VTRGMQCIEHHYYMKHLRGFISSFVAGAIALAMVSTVAAQTANTGRAKVVKMKGQARFSPGNNVWQPLKVGDVLKPGTIIQTAMEKGSYVDIVLGDGSGTASGMSEAGGGASSSSSPTPVANYQSKGRQNLVRIYENSALGLDKLTTMKTGADEVTETQLDLRAGHILGNVKKMSAASKYEIKLPNGVAGIRGTIYDITAEGVVKVADGSVVIAYMAADGSVTTKVVTGGNKFDARTGEITALTPADLATMRKIETTGDVNVQVSAPSPRTPLALDKTPTPETLVQPF
jgi:hypothetical protein